MLTPLSEDFVAIRGGVIPIGSTREEVEHCVAVWSARLLDPKYSVEQFRTWIEKEYPRHEVRLAAYRIGRYPVTNAQYLLFMASPLAPGEPPASIERGEPADHPVWGVSCEHALAYAAWLGARSGMKLRLPTEQEWEHAARGPEAREYPWGDTFDPSRCNTAEAGRGGTTAVDAYPNGRSMFDVWDLSGNVEEWTSSIYQPYRGGRWIHDDLAEALGYGYRVLRGGSFALGGDLARGGRRHGPLPSSHQYWGFRLAVDDSGAS